MKHLAVYHLSETIWLTEIVEDKDLVFNPSKLFMVPSSNETEIPIWKGLRFEPRLSKMYPGSEEPYSVHHYYPIENLDLNQEASQKDASR